MEQNTVNGQDFEPKVDVDEVDERTTYTINHSEGKVLIGISGVGIKETCDCEALSGYMTPTQARALAATLNKHAELAEAEGV